MSNDLTAPWEPSKPERLAKQFSWLGWIGFWAQLALIIVPILLLLYVLFIGSQETAQRKGIDLSDYLSQGSLWVGVGAGYLGVFFSMVLMINAVGRIFFVLMATPQTGVPLAAIGGDPAKTLSAINAVSMSALVFSLAAELIVLSFSLWLLFRVTRPSAKTAAAAD